jgi:anti-sigma factor RsiW
MVDGIADDAAFSEAHRDAQELLAWYATGKLEPGEHAQVAAHLAGCSECQRDLAFQHKLAAGIAAMPVDVEQGWTRLRELAEAEDAAPVKRAPGFGRQGVGFLGWGVAASLAIALGATLMPSASTQLAQNGTYHALGAAPTAAPGNMIVIFRPDVTEARMRGALRAAGARMVDGPTAADAYVLATPAGRRAAALALLKARHEIVLAEPMDAAAR